MNCTRAKLPPSTPAVVLIVSVFASPGHALDQEVALRQQADEHPLQHRVLPRDHAPDLDQGLLELDLRLLRGRTSAVVRQLSAHVVSSLPLNDIRKQKHLSLG